MTTRYELRAPKRSEYQADWTYAEALEQYNAQLVIGIKGALAALTQEKTYLADIATACIFLRRALGEE